MTHKEKFNDNARLFQNKDTFKYEKDSEEEDNDPKQGQWSKFKGNIQGDSDNEESPNYSDKLNDEDKIMKESKEDRRARVKMFFFELVYVSRVLQRLDNTASDSSISSKLLGFDHHPRESKHSKHKSPKNEQNLSDCLDYFRQNEKLDKDNSWYCSACKDHVEASKKIEIYSVPPVLIFCLQRFKSHNIYFKEKLEDKIVFPVENLDMSPYVMSSQQKQQQSMLYDLYAVSNHYGSLAFGHYTAYAKNPETGKWHDFNDSTVTEVDDPSELASPAAYVLYYIRKDFYPDGEIDYDAIKKVIDDPNEMESLT